MYRIFKFCENKSNVRDYKILTNALKYSFGRGEWTHLELFSLIFIYFHRLNFTLQNNFAEHFKF